MKNKSKAISGLKEAKSIIDRPNKYFTEQQKHVIIQEFLNNHCTKQVIWQKYTGQAEEHGQLLLWMRQLGYAPSTIRENRKLDDPIIHMAKKKLSDTDKDFEKLQLEKRIKDLEKQLRDAELKAIAFSTMVDIAEKEFNIPIRKKYNTKPLKK
jgi:transposase